MEKGDMVYGRLYKRKGCTQGNCSIMKDGLAGKLLFTIVIMTPVKFESYIDNSNSNHWIKVFDIKDNGGWFASSS